MKATAAPRSGELVATPSPLGALDRRHLLRLKRNQEPEPSTLCPVPYLSCFLPLWLMKCSELGMLRFHRFEE